MHLARLLKLDTLLYLLYYELLFLVLKQNTPGVQKGAASTKKALLKKMGNQMGGHGPLLLIGIKVLIMISVVPINWIMIGNSRLLRNFVTTDIGEF